MARRLPRTEPLPAAGLPRHRAVVALDIERSTSRPDPGDIYGAIVRHGYDGIDQHAFHPLVRVRIAGNRYPGWIHIPGQPAHHQVTEIASYRQPA